MNKAINAQGEEIKVTYLPPITCLAEYKLRLETFIESLIREKQKEARVDELECWAKAKIDHRGEPALFNPEGLPINTPRTEEMTRLVRKAAKDRIKQLKEDK